MSIFKCFRGRWSGSRARAGYWNVAALALPMLGAAHGATASTISLGSGADYGVLMMGRMSLSDFNANGTINTNAPVTGNASEIKYSHTEGGVFPSASGGSTQIGLMNGATFNTSGDPEVRAHLLAGTGSTLDTDFRNTGGSTNPLLGPGTGTTVQGDITYQTSPGGTLQSWESVGNVDPDLSQARSDVLAAYNLGVVLPTSAPFVGLTSLTSTATIIGTGQTVLNLTGGINLGNNEIVTLSGGPGTQFIINVSSEFKFQTGGIRVAGGVNPWDVIYNVTDGLKLTASGGGGGVAVPALPPAYITGMVIMPHPNSEIGLAPGAILGNLYFGGLKADFPSGGRVAAVEVPPLPREVPLPAAAWSGLALLASIGVWRRLVRR